MPKSEQKNQRASLLYALLVSNLEQNKEAGEDLRALLKKAKSASFSEQEARYAIWQLESKGIIWSDWDWKYHLVSNQPIEKQEAIAS